MPNSFLLYSYTHTTAVLQATTATPLWKHNLLLGMAFLRYQRLNPHPKSPINSPIEYVFWWLNPERSCSLYEILYPKRRIESYSIMSTTVSRNKILLNWGGFTAASPMPRQVYDLRGAGRLKRVLSLVMLGHTSSTTTSTTTKEQRHSLSTLKPWYGPTRSPAKKLFILGFVTSSLWQGCR